MREEAVKLSCFFCSRLYFESILLISLNLACIYTTSLNPKHQLFCWEEILFKWSYKPGKSIVSFIYQDSTAYCPTECSPKIAQIEYLKVLRSITKSLTRIRFPYFLDALCLIKPCSLHCLPSLWNCSESTLEWLQSGLDCSHPLHGIFHRSKLKVIPAIAVVTWI